MRRLFGTDGIRGVAGEPPLDEPTILKIGRALGRRLARKDHRASVVLGQDTRISSEGIANSLAQSLLAEGVSVTSAGVLTTPGVAYLARSQGFSAGIVVSASHNPWRDNGIKIFGGDGYKLPDEIELEIEREIFSADNEPGPDQSVGNAHAVSSPARDTTKGRSLSRQKVKAPVIGAPDSFQSLPGDAQLRSRYVEWLAASVSGVDLTRLHVLVDCANGAATPIAHEVFRRCGVTVTFIHDEPDGRNINDRCGALYPEVIAAAVRKANSVSRVPRFALGITLDGDADRALFADEEGNIVNGDAILLMCARAMLQHGNLPGKVVVATTMSNMGLELALRDSGIRMVRAPVGDKYVLEEMRRAGATLGGEQSGHILFLDGDATTGDGLLTALRVVSKMARAGRSLRELTQDLTVFPQTIKNVRVREKRPLEQVPEIAEAIGHAEAELNGSGRVVVRYSGTEPLARVMIEAEDESRMHRLADSVARAIQKHLGA